MAWRRLRTKAAGTAATAATGQAAADSDRAQWL